ncbi:FMN-linked oxidoreductase [Hymenopellis radicata]|nr:FMN-linked oxidoreductase [Hymenopellis radicata]
MVKRVEHFGLKRNSSLSFSGINGIRTRSLRFTGGGGEDSKPYVPSVVPKGIKTAEDARTCLQLGFPAIYVSNHGGRTLDGAPTAVEILLDIRRNAPEVFAGMEVYADGGVRRGSHVITLLALGARAVGLGRSPVFANIWGEAGVSRLIDMMKTEIETTMELMGQANTATLDATSVNTKMVEAMYFGF